jgi:4-hydroxy-3-polyprenylbenzoate decarboxylase
MPFDSTEDFLRACIEAGEAIEITREVDWDLEAGAIVRRVCETGAPAPFFTNIMDYPGHRMAGATCASFKRMAIALDLDPETPVQEIADEFGRRRMKHIKPVMIEDAPVQENVIMGDDVDLSKFPAPMVHDGDGGRFLSTWHFVVTRDEATDWTNWGMYRQMVHNEKCMGTLALPHGDLGKMIAKKEITGEKIPAATVIGPDPLCAATGCTPAGVNVSEVDLAGGLRQKPVELVKCKTLNLEVPAHAEIIIEGHIVPNVRVDEGPFGEYTGFRTSPRGPRPVFEVECITHRNNPIVTMSNMGIPTADGNIIVSGLGNPSVVKKLLRDVGIPVTGVYSPPEGCGFILVVAARKPYNNIAVQIGNAIHAHPMFQGYNSQVIVVDETVDPTNWSEVIHAMAMKLHPTKGITQYPSSGAPLSPFLSIEERKQMRGGKVIYDCTWPVEWDARTEKPDRMSFKECYTEETQQLVLDNWQSYGYE